MKVKILSEHGYDEAMLGISLSYNQNPKNMPEVAGKLAFKDGGHNKFLESICVWLDITASRQWWQQESTYRVGISRQSESTMHTILNHPLAKNDFAESVDPQIIRLLNKWIGKKNWIKVKENLPEGFLQRRIVCTNYMALQRMIRQRENHRLPEWREFIDAILAQVQHPELLERT